MNNAKTKVEKKEPEIDPEICKKINELQDNKKARAKDCNYKLKTITKKEATFINQFKNPREVLKDSTKLIAKNLNTVMLVAEHLHKIRKHQLFRLNYNSFKDYVNMEFNYTRGRAYQLTAAHEIAEYINDSIQQQPPVLTTEPQCRELIKVKKFNDDEHQELNEEQSNKERLMLVKNILNKNDNVISTQLIVDGVRDWLKDNNKDPNEEDPVARYDKSVNKSCENIDKMMQNIARVTGLSEKDFSQVKENMKKRLEETLHAIDKMVLANKNEA